MSLPASGWRRRSRAGAWSTPASAAKPAGFKRIVGEVPPPDVVVIALGANDGSRSLARAPNLARMIGASRGAKVPLVGMRMPPNLARLHAGFERNYRDLSRCSAPRWCRSCSSPSRSTATPSWTTTCTRPSRAAEAAGPCLAWASAVARLTHASRCVGTDDAPFAACKKFIENTCNARNVRALRCHARHIHPEHLPMKAFPHIAKPARIARCGCVRVAERIRATAGRGPDRLISTPGDRSPRSPRNANALGFQPGAFLFARSQTEIDEIRTTAIASHGIRARTARRLGFALPRRCHWSGGNAASVMPDAGGGRLRPCETDCRLATVGNGEHRSNTFQRYGLAAFAGHARPVRAALPWRMPKRGDGVPRADDSSAWESGANRWPPVRIGSSTTDSSDG